MQGKTAQRHLSEVRHERKPTLQERFDRAGLG